MQNLLKIRFRMSSLVVAPVISSSVDPNLTFLKMLDAKHLPDDFREEVKRYKFRGSSGKGVQSIRIQNDRRVRKILDEIGNQEQSIRAKEYDKGAKERNNDKDW